MSNSHGPTKGGSYLRHPDGSLQRLTAEEEAERSLAGRKTFEEAVGTYLDHERFKAAAVYDRIKEALGFSSDAELAWWFGTSPQSLWNRKRRNSVPYREAIYVSAWSDTSLEYILTGEGSPHPNDPTGTAA